jgi:hypothetical protein
MQNKPPLQSRNQVEGLSMYTYFMLKLIFGDMYGLGNSRGRFIM